jgi:hypothetical protein
MGRVAAILMVFVPLRPCAMFRIDPTTEKRGVDGKSIMVKAQDKTDVGKGVAVFALAEVKRRDSEGSLWRSKQRKPYKLVDNIRKFLAKILKDAKIPEVHKPYSIRHAVITALF